MRKPAGRVRLSFIRPMEPELVEQSPKGEGWSHEVKFDGYRTQVAKDAGGIRFFTKSGIDWTAKYRPLADEAKSIGAQSFILDGEVIVTNEAGLSDFHALRSAITRRPQDLYLVAFDLLHLNGIVSKRLDGVYRSGSTMNWRKIKCYIDKVMNIIGVKRETGKPAMVLLAQNGRYMGAAFVTFKADKRQRFWERVQAKAGAPPPQGLVKEKAEWLKPGLVGRVKCLKGEKKLRHASLIDFWGE
ncbi:ATP-dependent DNA ligase [Mesorhizobium sp.]|uniref:ATP-dependent DNA ligase n=1 Tax=Mesorhizobium sp. TaxID=1871066 RepID=UPI00120624B5|nr:ATP-dependent DNA ligase [Mesorhizobium sp.]TIV60220.1 MAG: ATP-dependent DNA ligase [Mesorhizobium sp.]